MAQEIGESTAARVLAKLTPWPEPAAVIGEAERGERRDRTRRLTRDLGAGALLIGAGDSPRYCTGVP